MSQGLGHAQGSAAIRPIGLALNQTRWKPLEDSLAMITTAACEVIDWVDCASISLAYGRSPHSTAVSAARPGPMETVGATAPVALKADALQWELGDGPGVDAAREPGIVHARDVRTDSRWSAYGQRVVELGITAQTGAGFFDGCRALGVLNLYALTAHDLDETSSAFVRLFAVQAATAIDFASRVEAQSLQIESRQVIGQAVGIVMERHAIDESAAFARLVEESQRRQLKLRLVARTVVDESNGRTT